MVKKFELLKWRQDLLSKLGGLPPPSVENIEWIYILKEETRNSIMIEGIFITSEELEEALAGGKELKKSQQEAVNYLRTASFFYGLGYQNFKTGSFIESIRSLVRQAHFELFKNVNVNFTPGEWRKGDVKIAGAQFQPPPFGYVEDWLILLENWVRERHEHLHPVELASKFHLVFECVHPFPDGNGRVGRIIMNYILLSKGLPAAVIKGDELQRKKYIDALTEAEKSVVSLFMLSETPSYEVFDRVISDLKLNRFYELLFQALFWSFDRIICERVGSTIKLMPLKEVAEKIGYSPDSLRKEIERGKLIACKTGRKLWLSSPELFFKG